MKANNKLIRVVAQLMFACTAMVSFSAGAAEVQPPGVMESWTCSYNAGKDSGDILTVRDYYVRQAAKADIKIGPAYMWSLVKGDLPFDFVWLAPHQSMGAYAANADAQGAAKELSDVTARFYANATCTPRLGTIRTVFQREVPDRGDAASIVTAFACTTRPGVGPAAIADLEGHVAGVLGGLGANSPILSFSMTSTTGGPNTPDWLFFNVFDSMTSWAKFTGGVSSSEAGPQLLRHFGAVADCDQAIWSSDRVIAPPTD